jgi:hypothetical protein
MLFPTRHRPQKNMTGSRKFMEQETVETGETVGSDVAISDLSGGVNQDSTLEDDWSENHTRKRKNT